MPIDYDAVMAYRANGLESRYDDRDVILYALGVGFMRDPLNTRELPFVYENALKVVPSFATVIARGSPAPGAPTVPLPTAGLNYLMVVDGERRLTLHKPFPPMAQLSIDERTIGVWDKGEGKGAILVFERVISDKQDGAKLATLVSSIFARGDGGFGGPREGAPVPHALPEREPDMSVTCDTRPDQAFLYALSGDRNPLHRDPQFAAMAGFPRPILHGLCSYGTAMRGILGAVCDYDVARVAGFDVRFSSPVFPGEMLTLDLWRDNDVVSFRARVAERNVTVLNNGKCTLRP